MSNQEERHEEYDRGLRMKVYSCPFCAFIEELVGFSNLEGSEEQEYVSHMKKVHGVSP